jgi:hypothetical protein
MAIMRLGLQRKTWVYLATIFLGAFITLTFAHLYIPHEHHGDGSAFSMAPFLHTGSNEKEIALLPLAAIAFGALASLLHSFYARRIVAFDGDQLEAHASFILRLLFSQGILHPKPY